MAVFPCYPISYSVEITYRCSNRCPECANVWHSRQAEELKDWKKLLDRIAPPNDRRKYADLIRITGGEPTLHPDFHEIVQYIDTFHVPFAVFSNGLWDKPDEIVRILSALDNFEGLLISLHGPDPVTHGAFTSSGEDSFRRTCDNISRAAEAGINVFTNSVITKHNCGRIDEIISLSESLGASCSVFNRLIGGNGRLNPDRNQLREVVEKIESLQNEGVQCRIGNCVPPCFVENSSFGSNSGIEHCAVSPTGLVRPDNHTDISFGNIFELSAEEIWQSDKARKYRENIPELCLECVKLHRCRGGLRSGSEVDPLMTKPVESYERQILEFDPDSIPIPYYRLRELPSGYLACRYNWSIPFDSSAREILDSIDGKTKLSHLNALYGEDALEIIGYLHEEEFIGFV